MRFLLGALLALTPMPAFAGGFFCTDVCSPDPVSGNTCNALGMGCNPITHVCVLCSDDTHCAPGGTCVDQACTGVTCQPMVDSGVPNMDGGEDGGAGDADDAGDMGVGRDADPADVEDVGVEDMGTVDLGTPDATDPTMRLPGARGGPGSNDEEFDDGSCGCRTTTSHARGGSMWILIGIGIAVLYRKCWRGVSVPGGKLRSL